MKSTTILCVLILFFTLSPKALANQYERYDRFLIECCMPLDCSKSNSVHNFLQNIFSSKRYAQEFLPYNLSHFIQFLDHGKVSNQKAPYFESAIRLFYNKIKASPFISPLAFSAMLDSAPALIKEQIMPLPDVDLFQSLEKKTTGIFVSTFFSQFANFKAQPEDFLKNLSHEVVTMIQNSFNVQDHIGQEHLKQIFIRFLDTGLMKLIWSTEDQLESWHITKKIAYDLTDCMNKGLMGIDDLDDLYKSLIESFCRFLDLAGSDLSIETINAIKEDIISDELLMFELEEQEEFIETKRERMLDALLQTEAKIEARMQGIITDVLAY